MAGTAGYFWVRETADGLEICGGSGGGVGYGGYVAVAIIGEADEDSIADANLLAAAPRMREVLRDLLSSGRLQPEDAQDVGRALEAADGD